LVAAAEWSGASGLWRLDRPPRNDAAHWRLAYRGPAPTLPSFRALRQDLANASLPDLGSGTPQDAGGDTVDVGGGGDVAGGGDGGGGGGGGDDGGMPSFEGDGDGDGDGGLSFQDVKGVFEEMTGLLDGPCAIPDLDQFVGLGAAVAGDLDDGAYGQVVNSMESGWVFGNIITQGTLHFAPAAEPAVG